MPLVAKQAQQHIVGRLVLGVQLEARPLEPLDHEHAIWRRFGLRVAQRQAKQRQALGLAGAQRTVELKAAGAPGPQDRAADVVAGRGGEVAVELRLRSREGRPVASALRQAIGAQAAKQHVIGRLVLGV